MIIKLASLLVFTMLLMISACSTPYQPLQRGGIIAGTGGGYVSKQLGKNEYEVIFAGNGFTSMETVEKFWHRKAKELCGSESYTHTIETKKVEHFPSARGTVKCN